MAAGLLCAHHADGQTQSTTSLGNARAEGDTAMQIQGTTSVGNARKEGDNATQPEFWCEIGCGGCVAAAVIGCIDPLTCIPIIMTCVGMCGDCLQEFCDDLGDLLSAMIWVCDNTPGLPQDIVHDCDTLKLDCDPDSVSRPSTSVVPSFSGDHPLVV